MVIIAETILLGILPLPSVLAAIGIVPGVLPQESLLKATTYHISVSHPHRTPRHPRNLHWLRNRPI